MELEGVIKNCRTYKNNMTSFRFESNSENVFYLNFIFLLSEGSYIRCETASSSSLEEGTEVAAFDLYAEKGGKLLHSYKAQNFIVVEKTTKTKNELYDDVKAGITQIVNEIAEDMDIEPSKIKDDSRFSDDIGFDSMALLELTAVVEKKYGISIPESEFPKLASIKDFADITCKYIARQQGR